MSESGKEVQFQPVPLQEVVAALRQTLPFAETSDDALSAIEQVDKVFAPAGAVLVGPSQPFRSYWVVIDGEIRADRPEPDGTQSMIGFARPGEGFGEVPLLTGRTHSPFIIQAVQDSHLVRFDEESFWKLLACCPTVRKAVLANLAQRLESYQVEALHREKLISLGTMAAGLMHELHNPGSAAKRAASQLRENLMRLQQLSLRYSNKPKTQNQLDCMKGLLEHALNGCRMPAVSSMEQADAEESMAEWLKAAGVENAYSIAPALVGIGFGQGELECAREYFTADAFSDTLNWLEALVSSVALVSAIEESNTRISDLVMAVKKYAYDEKSPARDLDVHDGLQSTLTILGHKLRMKQIDVRKSFSAAPSIIRSRGSGLSQVWTNLIDNAIDASPAGAQIEISTWSETEPGPQQGWLVVRIADRGPGIPAELLPRIFEAFFTTKPQGSGTGLGLEIVHRIVTRKFGGTIDVNSEPGNTQFIVRLPLESPVEPAKSAPAN